MTQVSPLFLRLTVCYFEKHEGEKPEFLGNAYAFLFPIDWSEPFGLVMIEAMACGTPVIAFRGGSVAEVIDEGVTGFIVEDIEQSVDALGKIRDFDRERCRKVFEERFSAARMAADYVKIYETLINAKSRPRGRRSSKSPAHSAAALAANGAAASRVLPKRLVNNHTSSFGKIGPLGRRVVDILKPVYLRDFK